MRYAFTPNIFCAHCRRHRPIEHCLACASWCEFALTAGETYALASQEAEDALLAEFEAAALSDAARAQRRLIRGSAEIRYRIPVRIANLSRIHTMTDVAPLVQFAKQHFKVPYMAVIVLRDQAPEKPYSQGRAQKERNWGRASPDNEPSCVELWLSPACSYPRTDSFFVPEVGAPTYESWEEETLYLLAHELQHIDDFWDGWSGNDAAEAYELEVRAERKATQVLRAWREECQLRELLRERERSAVPFRIDTRIPRPHSRGARRAYGKVARLST